MTLIKSDFQAIKKLVRLEIDEALEIKLEKKLEEKLGRYPTKDEFYAAMDKLMKELSTIREELALTPSFTQVADLEEKVEALEKQIHTL